MALRPATEIVSVGFDDHPALSSHVEKKLHDEVQAKIEALINAKDWPDYEKRRGEINGLNLAITICQNVTKTLQG